MAALSHDGYDKEMIATEFLAAATYGYDNHVRSPQLTADGAAALVLCGYDNYGTSTPCLLMVQPPFVCAAMTIHESGPRAV